QRIVEFLKREDGPTAVEYAVMLALIIVVCITAITALGTNANKTFTSVRNSIGWGTETKLSSWGMVRFAISARPGRPGRPGSARTWGSARLSPRLSGTWVFLESTDRCVSLRNGS